MSPISWMMDHKKYNSRTGVAGIQIWHRQAKRQTVVFTIYRVSAATKNRMKKKVKQICGIETGNINIRMVVESFMACSHNNNIQNKDD